jgi:hypothetical protein
MTTFSPTIKYHLGPLRIGRVPTQIINGSPMFSLGILHIKNHSGRTINNYIIKYYIKN